MANYSYLSNGTKLAAVDAAGNGLVYSGSLVYRKLNGNLSLESAAVEGGRIVAAQTAHGTAFLPRYHIADHLGSVRAVVGPGCEVLQQRLLPLRIAPRKPLPRSVRQPLRI